MKLCGPDFGNALVHTADVPFCLVYSSVIASVWMWIFQKVFPFKLMPDFSSIKISFPDCIDCLL